MTVIVTASPTESAEQFKVTAEKALRAYASRHGRTWRSQLYTAWRNGSDDREPEGAVLRAIRNNYGAAFVKAFKA